MDHDKDKQKGSQDRTDEADPAHGFISDTEKQENIAENTDYRDHGHQLHQFLLSGYIQATGGTALPFADRSVREQGAVGIDRLIQDEEETDIEKNTE
jgi:hypothetical protein